MRSYRVLAIATALAAFAVFHPILSRAQSNGHGGTEISVMHGFVLASTSTHNSDEATIVMTPVPPVWRLTFWTRSAVTLDLGFSLLTAASGGESVNILNLETGVGANLAHRNAKTVPFIGVVGGMISYSASHQDDETDPYLGAQIGARTFFRDFAAVRLQTGIRHLFVKNGKSLNLFEAVAGLSFFL
ncbi:MAG: hypothetical protein HZB43_09870 [candidate division Zixibacteria bacterium]|nr:hypothetical protein [candidate division Zixibacteria bacterium]